jgi:hypothetical protein
MSEQEQMQWNEIQQTVKDILVEIRGTPFGERGGINHNIKNVQLSLDLIEKRHEEFELRLQQVERKQRWYIIAPILIGVGILIGAVLFKVLTVQEALNIVK